MSWTLLAALATSAETATLVYQDALPTTLLPLYAETDADVRAHELLYDRLFYSSPVV